MLAVLRRGAVVAAWLPLGFACAPAAPASDVRDDFGDAIPFGATPTRIVSLDPSLTEICFALGAGPRVVGRTHWDLWSADVRAVADVGDGIRPNVEAVLGARPDLVLLYASEENRDAARQLRAAGVRVATFRIDRIAQFQRVAGVVSRLVGAPAIADVVIDSVLATIAHVRKLVEGAARPSVFLHSWENPLLTIGGGSFISELVEIAGGRNIFADLGAPSPQVSFEEVLKRNPDVVLASPLTAASLRTSRRWAALPAVRDGHVLEMDTTIVARPSMRLGEAALSLARLLHPGLVR